MTRREDQTLIFNIMIIFIYNILYITAASLQMKII